MSTVTFCGHGDLYGDEEVRRWLYNTLEQEIRSGADLFYLGGYGGFDRMAAGVVWELKKTYPQITSVLVLAYLNQEIDTEHYDETSYPPLEEVPQRFAISRRNRWMVDQADTVIAYVLHDWGGAVQTLQYAMRKHKRIVRFQPERKKM
jgi:uncharacterized phage-like protein YoqJ